MACYFALVGPNFIFSLDTVWWYHPYIQSTVLVLIENLWYRPFRNISWYKCMWWSKSHLTFSNTLLCVINWTETFVILFCYHLMAIIICVLVNMSIVFFEFLVVYGNHYPFVFLYSISLAGSSWCIVMFSAVDTSTLWF